MLKKCWLLKKKKCVKRQEAFGRKHHTCKFVSKIWILKTQDRFCLEIQICMVSVCEHRNKKYRTLVIRGQLAKQAWIQRSDDNNQWPLLAEIFTVNFSCIFLDKFTCTCKLACWWQEKQSMTLPLNTHNVETWNNYKDFMKFNKYYKWL